MWRRIDVIRICEANRGVCDQQILQKQHKVLVWVEGIRHQAALRDVNNIIVIMEDFHVIRLVRAT